MANVPYTPFNTVTPGGIPDDYQRSNASPETFGAASARALGGVGEAVSRTGAVVGDALIRHQGLVDEASATDASTAFMQKSAAMFGDYSQLKGRAAVDGAETYQRNLNDLWANTRSSLPNESARLLFTRGTRRTWIENANNGDSWRDKQRDAWVVNSAQGRADAFGNQVATATNNPDMVPRFLVGGADEIRKAGETLGKPPEAIDSDVLKWQGRNLNLLIEGKMRGGDVNGAQSLFNQFRPQMDAESVNKTETALAPALLDAHSDAVVSKAMGTAQAAMPAGSTAVGPGGFANNVGNLKSSSAQWIGKGTPYNGFETFDTPTQGAAAAGRNIMTIAKRNGGQLTLSELAPVWAPDSDGNDPAAWAAQVSKETGIGLDAQIPLNSPTKMASLLKAVSRVEKGGAGVFPDSVYQQGAEAAIKGAPLPNAADAGPAPNLDGGLPDESSVIARAIQMSGGDARLQGASVAKIRSQYALHDAITETARQDLATQVPAVMKAALAGDQRVTLPKMDGVLPAADVARYQTEFTAAKQIGELTKGVMWASPGDLSSAEADTRDLTGAIGDTIAKAAGTDQAMRLDLQSAAMDQLKSMQIDRDKMLLGEHSDPVAYVSTHPMVREAALTMAARGNDPESVKSYAQAVLAVQTMLGVPPEKQRVLSNDQAARGALAVSNADPETVGNVLDQYRTAFGDQGLKEVLSQAGVPAGAKLVAFADLPSQAALRGDAVSAMKIKDDDMAKGMAVFGVTPGDLEKSFKDVAKPLMQTIAPGAAAPYLDSVEHLAGYYVMQGMDKDDAAKKAFGIFNKAYVFADTYRIPTRWDGGKVQDGAAGALVHLDQFNIEPQPGAPIGVGSDYAQQQAIKQLRNGGGRWVTNADETGLVLTYDVGRDGTIGPAVIVNHYPEPTPQQAFDRNKAFIKPGATDFQTKLPADQEQRFRAWVKDNSIPFDPASAEAQDYDMRGFWRALQGQDASPAANKLAVTSIDPNDGKMHFPDYWKTPYHATFSNESQYASAAAPHWNAQDQLVGSGGAVLFDDRNRYGRLEVSFDDLERGAFGSAPRPGGTLLGAGAAKWSGKK